MRLKPSPHSGSAALRLEALWVEGRGDQVRGSLIKEAGGKGREEEGEACEGFMENMQCK